MKKLLTSVAVMISMEGYCQTKTGLETTKDILETNDISSKSEETKERTIKGIIKNPDLYNDIWGNYIKGYISDNWAIARNLNIEFKTFQTEENPVASLGLAYDFNFEYGKFISDSNASRRILHEFGFSTKGNVAFNRKSNPVDFLVTNASYNIAAFTGGVRTTNDATIITNINNTASSLSRLKDPQSEEAMQLWEQLGQNIKLTNQYYYSAAPKFALESNQNFSKVQFAPGITFGLGAKAWNDDSFLSKISVFDYPFALIRLLTKTDKEFTPYGATIPTALLGFDYIKPVNDTTREGLTNNDNLFPRFRFETGFRTYITKIKNENIFFNANYRVYREIKSSDVIRTANLDKQNYFVMALQSTSGLFVSYANGRLPFDVKDDQIYSLGFNYKLR